MVARLLTAVVLIGLLGACAATRTSGELFPTERTGEVQVGMREEEVINLLGVPYVKEPYIGGAKWIWSYSTELKDHTFVVTIVDNLVASRSEYIHYH